MMETEHKARYGGCKPCLHGSDSHDQESVGQPIANRFSWIKGALDFDALRQACIDPEGRAYVGGQPPRSALQSQVISHIRIDSADWAVTPDVPLNPGLVAIIGARGSGKTALADVIAAGCDAISPSGWEKVQEIERAIDAATRRSRWKSYTNGLTSAIRSLSTRSLKPILMPGITSMTLSPK